MNDSNVSLNSSCPVFPSAGKFFVTATKEITAPKRVIRAGEHILVDPGKEPSEGKMVLCGSRCEPWAGQEEINGVVVALWHDAV